MFIESRPVTGFGETAGWALPLMPQEPVERLPLRRPPLRTNNSSTPSLAGMEQTIPPTLKQPPLTTNDTLKSSLIGYEQTIPPFKDFVRQTPPLEDDKSLPPTPLRDRSSFDATTHSFREPSPSAPRRTSSVYSRTVSQWFAESPTWSASDLADNPIPALPLEYLQPIAYSASTPQLKETTPAGPFLQPRTYQPLLTTPSPTASRCTSREPSPRRASSRKDLRISVLLPTAFDVAQIPRTHLRTVSLEKAKANSGAVGAEHLLPEEQRAKSKGKAIPKARSLEPIVKPPVPITRDTMAMFGRSVDLGVGPNAPSLPSMTLVDAEGRDRVVGAPRLSVAPSPTFAFSEEPILSPSHTMNAFPVGNNAPRTMVSLAAQNQEELYTAEREHAMSDRGRTIQRGSRNSDYNQYQHNGRRRRSSSSANAQADSQRMSQEYHSMLAAEQHRQASASSASRSIASDVEVGTRMKMVPQPLFNGKLSVIASGSDKRSRYDSGNSSVSPFHFHRHQHEQSNNNSSLPMQSQTSGSGYDYFQSPPQQAPRAPRPPRLSTEAANRRRRSSVGMIPISPPFQYTLSLISPKAAITMAQPRNIPPHRRNSDDNRMSTYWRIQTKGGESELRFRRSKEKKPSASTAVPSSSTSPGLPLLGADVIAQRLRTPAMTPEKSPNVQEPWPVQQQQRQRQRQYQPQQQQYQPNTSRPISTPSPLPSPGTRVNPSPPETTREEKNAKELTAKQALFSRITKGAVKYADKLTRPAGYEPRSQSQNAREEEERERGRSITLANLHTLTHPTTHNGSIARKESPHLYHSQHDETRKPDANGKQRPAHASKPSLGWSNAAKTAFDEEQEHLLLLRQYQHQQHQQHDHNQDQKTGSRKEEQQTHVQYAHQSHDQYPRQMQQYTQRTPYPQPQSQFQPQSSSRPQQAQARAQSKDSSSSNKPSQATRYTHTTTPARPLDGRGGSGGAYNTTDDEENSYVRCGRMGSEGGGGGGGGGGRGDNKDGRRSSFFSAFRSEARREAKAEKRRGEIKRSIRVVGVNGSEG